MRVWRVCYIDCLIMIKRMNNGCRNWWLIWCITSFLWCWHFSKCLSTALLPSIPVVVTSHFIIISITIKLNWNSMVIRNTRMISCNVVNGLRNRMMFIDRMSPMFQMNSYSWITICSKYNLIWNLVLIYYLILIFIWISNISFYTFKSLTCNFLYSSNCFSI